jgi:hypothetical protein
MKKTHLFANGGRHGAGWTAAAVFGSLRPVTILVDGEAQTLQTRAMTAAQAMNEAGLALGPGDQVSQPPESLLAWNGPLVIERASQVQVWNVRSDPLTSHIDDGTNCGQYSG